MTARALPPSLTDLAGLRTVTVAALAGHSQGTAGANGRAQRGGAKGARDAQSSALKRLYTLRESAVYLGVGYGKVRDYVARGIQPAVRLPGGKLIHVTVDDLERLVLTHREPA